MPWQDGPACAIPYVRKLVRKFLREAPWLRVLIQEVAMPSADTALKQLERETKRLADS